MGICNSSPNKKIKAKLFLESQETNILNGAYTYREVDCLERVTFGKIYKGTIITTGQAIAIRVSTKKKLLNFNNKKVELCFKNEKKLIQTLTVDRNPHLVDYIDAFETTDKKYIVTAFYDGGTLADIIDQNERLSQEEIQKIIYQIILGLSALHDKGIVHMDIKPDNIFIYQNVCKIGGFLFAQYTNKPVFVCGTCIYMGPEFVDGQKKTKKIDVWALGCILHQLLFCTLAFDGNNQKEIEVAVKKGYSISTSELDPEIQDLLMGMLTTNIEQRYSIEELKIHRAFQDLSLPDTSPGSAV